MASLQLEENDADLMEVTRTLESVDVDMLSASGDREVLQLVQALAIMTRVVTRLQANAMGDVG